jgi:hypothetical protein
VNGTIEVTLESSQCATCNGGCGLGCSTKSVAGLPATTHGVGDRVLVCIDREPVRQALCRAFGAPLVGLLLGAAAADRWLASQPSIAEATGEALIAGVAGVGLLAGVLAARRWLRADHGCRIDVVDAPGGTQASLTAAGN